MEKLKIKNFNSQVIKYLPTNVVNFTIPVKNSDVALILSKCIIIQPENKPKISVKRNDKHYLGFKICESVIGKIDGLPDKVEGTILIVPAIIYQSLYRTRDDLFVIDEPIRDEGGKVIACQSFSRPRYVNDDNAIKSVANSFDNSYNRILQALSDKSITSLDEFRKIIIKEEENLFNAVVKLNALTK